jgi:hypothetical protein
MNSAIAAGPESSASSRDQKERENVKSCYSTLFTSRITGKTRNFAALDVYMNSGFLEFQVFLDEFIHCCTRWAPHKRTVTFPPLCLFQHFFSQELL